MLNSFLIPPRIPDGVATQREPKSLSDELRDEAALIRESAISDIILFSVENAVNHADIDIRKAVNARNGFMKWTDVDALILEAAPLIGPAIQKAIAERDALEAHRIKFQTLVALFNDIRVQKNGGDPDKYDLIGLTEQQLRKCADALAQGTDE